MNNVPKLKIGLLMDSFDVPYWVYKIIEKIQDSTHSQISLIIMNQTEITKNNPILKVKNNRDYFLYKIYTRLENKTYHPDIDAFQIKNTAELLENIEKIAPDFISTGNIGCMTQIGGGTKIPIVHTVEVMDWLTGGPKPYKLKNF